MENIFQRPPILMRLTMLTRDKMSLLRAASLRTAWETAHGLNNRKQRGWVEAGILRVYAGPFSGKGSELIIVRAKRELPSIDATDLEQGEKMRHLTMALAAERRCY